MDAAAYVAAALPIGLRSRAIARTTADKRRYETVDVMRRMFKAVFVLGVGALCGCASVPRHDAGRTLGVFERGSEHDEGRHMHVDEHPNHASKVSEKPTTSHHLGPATHPEHFDTASEPARHIQQPSASHVDHLQVSEADLIGIHDALVRFDRELHSITAHRLAGSHSTTHSHDPSVHNCVHKSHQIDAHSPDAHPGHTHPEHAGGRSRAEHVAEAEHGMHDGRQSDWTKLNAIYDELRHRLISAELRRKTSNHGARTENTTGQSVAQTDQLAGGVPEPAVGERSTTPDP